MVIYRISSNFLKGIQDFEILRIENENEFTYKNSFWDKEITRTFEKKHSNDSQYFMNKADAILFLREKLTQSIKKHKEKVKKYELFLNSSYDL